MKGRLAVAGSLCAMAALIWSSGEVAASCRYALSLCCELIIPSLFPFFIVSVLLNRLGLPRLLGRVTAPASRLLFGVSGAGGTAFIMGLCGGYPLGAAYTAEMYESGCVGREEAERLLGFCNNSGPAFIIGAIGVGVFHSSAAGIYLYVIHIAAAAVCGMVMRADLKNDTVPVPEAAGMKFSLALTGAIKQAVVSILNVCGFVCCFTVLVGLLDADGFFSLLTGRFSELSGAELHWMRGLLTGFLELGSGVGEMRGLSLSPINLALAAFLVGWGGISVHFQTMAQIADSGLEGSLHFPGRLICGSTAAVLAYFCAGLLA